MNHRTNLLMASLSVFGLMACELNGMGDGGGLWGRETEPEIDVTDPPFEDEVETAAPEETRYYAIFLEDRWNERCATSGVGAHGADIDAVSLWDPSGDASNPELIAVMDVIDAGFDRNTCETYGYDDLDQALGDPDGTLTDSFYSLAGGWLIGEFESGVELLPEYEVTVHEIDDSYCGWHSCVGSERYDVWVATDIDCVNQPDFKDSCMVKITGDDGALGTAHLPLRSLRASQ